VHCFISYSDSSVPEIVLKPHAVISFKIHEANLTIDNIDFRIDKLLHVQSVYGKVLLHIETNISET
jgi:hypothetical protein